MDALTRTPGSGLHVFNTSLSVLPAEVASGLHAVAERYPFRASPYYLNLIDWNDPADPIRRLIVPDPEELEDGGSLDPSNEASHTVATGVQHKYPHTVLLLCSESCAGQCRYCFRKRLFMSGRREMLYDLPGAIAYIAQHTAVTNVLLTGGDPLMMPTARLVDLLGRLRAIPHVKVIRIGSKMPAFNPRRITADRKLLQALGKYSEPDRRIYLMTHFDHPRELTDEAVAAVDACLRAGVICANQCPMLKGINDDPGVLSDLFRRLSWVGCPPYYLFQCRPTVGNRMFQVPIVRGWQVFRSALTRGSGLAVRARYVMSHQSGKIEVLAVDRRHIYLRHHRAARLADRGLLMVCRRDDRACWFDELEPVSLDCGEPLPPVDLPGDDACGEL